MYLTKLDISVLILLISILKHIVVNVDLVVTWCDIVINKENRTELAFYFDAIRLVESRVSRSKGLITFCKRTCTSEHISTWAE